MINFHEEFGWGLRRFWTFNPFLARFDQKRPDSKLSFWGCPKETEIATATARAYGAGAPPCINELFSNLNLDVQTFSRFWFIFYSTIEKKKLFALRFLFVHPSWYSCFVWAPQCAQSTIPLVVFKWALVWKLKLAKIHEKILIHMILYRLRMKKKTSNSLSDGIHWLRFWLDNRQQHYSNHVQFHLSHFV